MTPEPSRLGQLGNYELLEVLGSGTGGKVYKARCVADDVPGVKFGEIVALKKLWNQGQDLESHHFHRERESLRKLDHPNIVRYKDSFVEADGETYCLVMEYLDGETLKERIAPYEVNPKDKEYRKGLPWPEASRILDEILDALVFASQAGVVHRDLKTSNIYLTKEEVAKLLDFGIARITDNSEGTATNTTGGAKGTFDYMAPDFLPDKVGPNFRGDEQSDIFSFGIVMYYTLAASLPFPPLGENAHARWIMRWLGKNPPVAKYTQPAFEILSRARSCILQCINPDRAARFKTFAEVRAAFAKIHYRRIMQGEVVYELTELLGKGGFGKVYLARHTGTGAVVAIKYLYSNGQDARFKREQKILKEYPHRYLTQYLDFIEEPVRGDECKLYLVMEYLEGMPGASLRDRIKQSDGGLDPVEVMHLFVCYLDCLDHLHQHEIIHRDIKPGNLYALAGKPEQARIFDLGIAHDQLGTVTNGRVPGTLDYMPPEFAMQESGRGSPQSDIYSLGVTFYQALTGELPFPRLPASATDGFAAFVRRAENPLPCNYDFPAFKTHPALADITRRALAYNPQERPPSAAAMRDEIKQVMVGLRETLPRLVTQGGAVYELTGLIGEPGRSRIFKGTDLASGRQVAVKYRYCTGQETKYKAAAQTLRQNPHPQVVQYLDFIELPVWAEESQLYVVLELWPDMPGAGLDARIQQSRSGLDPQEVLRFFVGYLDGLEHLHKLGIIHRAVKPANLYAPKDRPELARIGDHGFSHDRDGAVLSDQPPGVLDYQPPEFANPESGRGSPQSDIYSLGVVLYEALTGNLPLPRLPGGGPEALAAFMKRSGESLRCSFEHPTFKKHQRLVQILQRAFAYNPQARHRSAAAMREEIKQWLAAQGTNYNTYPRRITNGEEAYELTSLIGKGWFGEVSRGRKLSNDQVVAIKYLYLTGQTERFKRENRMLRAHPHPNLIQYLDVIEAPAGGDESKIYLVLEHLEGLPETNLGHRIRQAKTGLDPLEAMQLFLGYLRGLAHLHGQSPPIIHRDLKPDKLYAPAGHPEKAKIYDLGITLQDEGTANSGPAPGALNYLPPECVTSQGESASPRSDIYSLGVAFYETLTGKLPFPPLPNETNEAMAVLFKRCENPLKCSYDFPVFEQYESLEQILRKALKQDPDGRYDSASAMRAELQKLLPGEEEEETLATTTAQAPAAGFPSARETSPEEAITQDGTGIGQFAETSKDFPPAALPAEPVRDPNVQFTVFRPQVVAPQIWHLLPAFAHLSERRPDAAPEEPDPIQEVQRQARQALGEKMQDYRPVTHDSTESVPRAGELTFVPEVAGIEFNPPRATFRWLESVHRQDFRMRAAAALDGQTARGRLTVFLGIRIIADVELTIRVSSAAKQADSVANEFVSASPYRKVFASYSRKDAAVVDEFEQVVATLGDQYLRDSQTLRAGEIYNERLAEMIREADIFQLFWSTNSMKSPFVRKEWEQAISLNRQHFIRPVYWEDPLPEDAVNQLPPDVLRRIHFHQLVRHIPQPEQGVRLEAKSAEAQQLEEAQQKSATEAAKEIERVDIPKTTPVVPPVEAILPLPAPAPAKAPEPVVIPPPPPLPLAPASVVPPVEVVLPAPAQVVPPVEAILPPPVPTPAKAPKPVVIPTPPPLPPPPTPEAPPAEVVLATPAPAPAKPPEPVVIPTPPPLPLAPTPVVPPAEAGLPIPAPTPAKAPEQVVIPTPPPVDAVLPPPAPVPAKPPEPVVIPTPAPVLPSPAPVVTPVKAVSPTPAPAPAKPPEPAVISTPSQVPPKAAPAPPSSKPDLAAPKAPEPKPAPSKRPEKDKSAPVKPAAAAPVATKKPEPPRPEPAPPAPPLEEHIVARQRWQKDREQAAKKAAATERAAKRNQQIKKVARPVALACLSIAILYGGIVGFVKWRSSQRESTFQKASAQAQVDFNNQDYASCLENARQALAIYPDNTNLSNLLASAESMQQLLEKFDQATNTVSVDFERHDYSNALKWAVSAVGIIPGDPNATALVKQAESYLEAYREDVRGAFAAYKANDSTNTLDYAEKALAFYPNDNNMLRFKEWAESKLRPPIPIVPVPPTNVVIVPPITNKITSDPVAEAQRKQYAAYRQYFQRAEAFYNLGDYTNALHWAQQALNVLTNGPEAKTLLKNSQDALQEYSLHVNQAQSAYENHDYTRAAEQAGKALKFYPGNSSLKMIVNESARHNECDNDVSQAQAAYDTQDYENALAWAGRALDIYPDDPPALKIQSDARSMENLKNLVAQATTLIKQGALTQALKVVNQGLEISNTNSAMLDLKEKILIATDSELVQLMDGFNVDVPKSLLGARKIKTSPYPALSTDDKTAYINIVNDLKSRYGLGNWPALNDRQKAIQDLLAEIAVY